MLSIKKRQRLLKGIHDCLPGGLGVEQHRDIVLLETIALNQDSLQSPHVVHCTTWRISNLSTGVFINAYQHGVFLPAQDPLNPRDRFLNLCRSSVLRVCHEVVLEAGARPFIGVQTESGEAQGQQRWGIVSLLRVEGLLQGTCRFLVVAVLEEGPPEAVVQLRDRGHPGQRAQPGQRPGVLALQGV
jgi:hypothetical protein